MQFLAVLSLLTLIIAEALCTCGNGTNCFNDLPCCGNDTRGNALCCPYRDGICCGDGQHCCDKEFQCHPDKGICTPLNKMRIPLTRGLQATVPLLKRNAADPTRLEEMCPSKKQMCPGKATCCPGPYIGFDCCPLPNGECCANFQHCCPFNTICDSKQGLCIDAKGKSSHWYRKTKAVSMEKQIAKKVHPRPRNVFSFGNATCPTDPTIKCEANQTCCAIGQKGKHACCNVTNAVCCPGGHFCCPQGTECDIFGWACFKRTTRQGSRIAPVRLEVKSLPCLHIPPFNDSLIKQAMPHVNLTLVCPGGKYSCPSYKTCCPTKTGKYGCCPFPNAICCSDSLHCCPTGSKCDLEHNKCQRGGLFMPLFIKTKALKVIIPQIIPNDECPDKSQCPDTATCCQLPSKDYGCCPLVDAVCCSDKIHCCPQATVCDLEAGGCRPESKTNANAVSLMSFKNVQKREPPSTIIGKQAFVCPGGLFECPLKNACCRLEKRWGCCPFEKGVCCNNNKNCCPEEFKCDLVKSQCIKENVTINF